MSTAPKPLGKCPIAPASAADGKYAYDASGMPMESIRRLRASFVRVDPQSTKKMFFGITNDVCAAVDMLQARLYTYAADGKLLDSAQVVAREVGLEPGQTKEVEFSIGDPPALGERYELEPYSARNAARERVWSNENVTAAQPRGRKPGGISDDDLANHAGQPVLGYFLGRGKKSKFSVKNVGAKGIKQLSGFVHYYDKDGKRLDGHGNSNEVALVLAPGATSAIEVGFERKDIPAGTAKEEVTIFEVTYEDGKVWTNWTLASDERPLGG